jgi:hypothetical protein
MKKFPSPISCAFVGMAVMLISSVREMRLMCLRTLFPPHCLPPDTATGRRPSIPNTCLHLVLPNTGHQPFPNIDRLPALPHTGHHQITGCLPALPPTGHLQITGRHLLLLNTFHLPALLNMASLLPLKSRWLSLPNTGSLLAINTAHRVPKNVRAASYPNHRG